MLNIKRYRKVLAVLLVMCFVLSGCSKEKEEATNDISSVKLKSNQEIVACKITAIYGNEIEYTVVKEQSASDSNSKKGKMPSASGAPDMNGGNMPSGGGASNMNGGGDAQNNSGSDSSSNSHSNGHGGNKNENDMSAGGPPDMGNGDMQQGGGAPDMDRGNPQSGDISSDKSVSQNSFLDSSDKKSGSDSSKSSDKSNKTVYTLTDETGSTTIPVGTDVITSLGKTTTFSRLSNGDIIKMILEKDSSGEKIVVGVWIVS